MVTVEKTDQYELVKQARRATWSLGGAYVLLLANKLTGSGPASQALHAFGEDSVIFTREPLPNSRQVRNAYRIMQELQPISGIEEHPDIEALLEVAKESIRFLEGKSTLLPEPPPLPSEEFERELLEQKMGRIVFTADIDSRERTSKAKITSEEYWFLRGLLDLAGTEQSKAFRNLPKVEAALVRLVKKMGGMGNRVIGVWVRKDSGLTVKVGYLYRSGFQQTDHTKFRIEQVSLWTGDEWNE